MHSCGVQGHRGPKAELRRAVEGRQGSEEPRGAGGVPGVAKMAGPTRLLPVLVQPRISKRGPAPESMFLSTSKGGLSGLSSCWLQLGLAGGRGGRLVAAPAFLEPRAMTAQQGKPQCPGPSHDVAALFCFAFFSPRK